METRCDYCVTEPALVYCESDLATLCLHCDVCIHSANPLSQKHTRSLICGKCLSQSAVIHCLDEKVSICQECYWITSNCSGLRHRLQTLNHYSGCPSFADFSKIWSPILEPVLKYPSNALMERMKTDEFDDICEGINFDDTLLNFNANDDIFGCLQYDETKYNLYEDTKPDNKLNVSESNHIENSNEISHSMSNVTEEKNSIDHHDCRLSLTFARGDSPWESNVEVSCPKSREEAKIRYIQKRSIRMFGKQIRYASRKARADTRKRVKGRFVKSRENYVDCDISII